MMCVIMPLIMLFKIICFLKIVINAVETSVHIAGEQILVFEFVGNGDKSLPRRAAHLGNR